MALVFVASVYYNFYTIIVFNNILNELFYFQINVCAFVIVKNISI